MKLSEAIRANRRFSRSANVERDHGAAAIDGYLPTGRALDVVGRIGRGMSDPSSGRAFSITGPHGGGKSSLAVFLDALLAPRGESDHHVAVEVLRTSDAEAFALLDAGLRKLDPEGLGAIRAFATADREPVTVTVARALHGAAVRELGARQRIVPAAFLDESLAQALNAREILSVIRRLSATRPLVLLIDEFGKNLEAYAQGDRDGDPYLLQELAEAAQGQDALPLVLVTMQHLSFDEYVQEASVARRREWAKVQGRFQDIPYVETAAQSRRLIGATITRDSSALDSAWDRWRRTHGVEFRQAGLRELYDSTAASYPLHPLVLAVLPDLCSRYGQNERTLFSFLAGPEPQAVPAFLDRTSWSKGRPLPFVRLDHVYDYFLDSATTSIGTSSTASRWLEIESRIRDTAGLTEEQSRVLKSIGVLNLVSSAGSLRASKGLLSLALTGSPGFESDVDVQALLVQLEELGLVTYRDFADEYRIWNGSDFDLRNAVELGRRAAKTRSLADLLNDSLALDPAIAGRHSQEWGVLRVFERRFSDLREADLAPPDVHSEWDGRVLYSVSGSVPRGFSAAADAKALVVVAGTVAEGLGEAAVEAAALQETLRSATEGEVDWVARRELIERASAARQRLADLVSRSWNPASSRWTLLNDGKAVISDGGTSAALSKVADRIYTATPRVANEMIAKRELTSQGAKARRELIEALIEAVTEEALGITGYGPERAMYEAVFRSPGLHAAKSDTWQLTIPSDRRWRVLWEELDSVLSSATDARLNLVDVGSRLKAPPFGLKDGILPVLLVTALLHRADDIALYEHGSLVLALDDAVAERLAKNPGHFTVKNAGVSRGARRTVVEAVASRLAIRPTTGPVTFLQVTRALYRELRELPAFTQQTKRGLSDAAIALRTAFRTATEPDQLLFEAVPEALGLDCFPIRSRLEAGQAEAFANRLADTLLELRTAYPELLGRLARELSSATAIYGDLPDVQRRLGGEAANLVGQVLDPRLGAFVGALSRTSMDPGDWLANVAMVVAEGQTTRSWTDSTEVRFELQIAELGGMLRRTSALLFERRAGGGEAFDARRVTVTKPDGSEQVYVLSLGESSIKAAAEELGEPMARLAEQLGSSDAARQTLLAWLVMTDGDSASKAEAVRLAAGEVAE